MDVNTYKPPYIWPNPAFPFRIYLDHPKCRIFIIENIHHNWEWMKIYAGRFKKNDVFLVYCGWYQSEEFAAEAETIFNILGLNKNNFYFLYNSGKELLNFETYGFQGEIINQNAWLDENVVMKPLGLEKKYNAIYVARRSAFKRHQLAAKVENLALVAGINHGNVVVEVPDHVYINDRQLTPEEVCIKINEAKCGLILSASEGACFSSSEYLLCGVPVVSTPATGGRHAWYNEYNSIVCDPNPDSVADAVDEFLKRPRDPLKIREMHIELSVFYRKKFIELLRRTFKEYGVDLDPDSYFKENFFHKLRKSYKPNFDEIFKAV